MQMQLPTQPTTCAASTAKTQVYKQAKRSREQVAKIRNLINELPQGVRYIGRPQTFTEEFLSFLLAQGSVKTPLARREVAA